MAPQNNDQKVPTTSESQAANSPLNALGKPNQKQATAPPQVSAAKPKLDIKPLRFPPMPIEQNSPNIPKLKFQSPPVVAPQPQAPTTQPPRSKLQIFGLFGLFFNRITTFIIIVILFFVLCSGLILAYTDYGIYKPPKVIRNFFDALIAKTPLPKL